MGITMGARRNGKTARTIEAIREALAAGEHVHLAGPSGTRCIDGPPGCTVPRRTITQLERELER